MLWIKPHIDDNGTLKAFPLIEQQQKHLQLPRRLRQANCLSVYLENYLYPT